jgi:hypothetical protein
VLPSVLATELVDLLNHPHPHPSVLQDAKKAAKDAAAKGGGAAAGGGDAAKIATLQKKWMPVVKEGE